MLRYRIRFFDEGGRVDRMFILWGESGEQVLDLVRRLGHPHRVEIFHNDNLLARLDGAQVVNAH